ncbi:radical SAM protein [Acetivibrio straminisolvens]|uniref:Fe-S oxidoreductase n=1 Tax=Acetivibrio straminisolvens JCM 21531 TaxID=1294263 RepID=W4V2X4_9FIRM|nr:radical SAM protein [Acetivibrio straminisolvens]GAE87462.1 Fe-S oxidoreductase [Acetivibrio straminisolvens JCM 21531]
MEYRPIPIKRVLPGSIAEESDLQEGDFLLSVNGERIGDIFDYRFLITDENLVLEVQKKDGEIWEIEIEKDEYEDLGIEFESLMIDDAKSCRNKCIFCFIDQLPKGMRETLYFKDDDSRLSFFMGNYVTLTNMSYNDIDRIIKYKMSPINVSVHTSNPELRVYMLKNKTAGDVMDKIKRLIDGGITVNAQIVLVREVNDGKELDRTLGDLSALYPGLNSVSVVPVGITKHRDGLYKLKPFDKESSRKVVEQVEAWQRELLSRCGSRIVFLADEFYIMGELDMPDYCAYEDFPQIENGVGLIAMFKKEFDDYLEKVDFKSEKKREVAIATGVSSYKYIKEMIDILERKYENLSIHVYKIKNRFFGENVTVTGLLTGQDIAEQLLGKNIGEELLISESMLRTGEKVFLDDYTVGMLEDKLETKIGIVSNNGKDFIEKILGIVL